MEMGKILTFFKRRCCDVIDFAVVCVSLLLVTFSFATSFFVLRRAGVVVMMSEGGFGHTILGPDLMRRLHSENRCVFITCSQYGRHNRQIAQMWQDIDYFFLSVNFGLQIRAKDYVFGRPFFVTKFFVYILRQILRDGVLFFEDLEKFYAHASVSGKKKAYDISIPESIQTSKYNPVGSDFFRDRRYFIEYYRLLNTVDKPPLRVPSPHREVIGCCLDEARGYAGENKQRRLCCLYLRQKGGDDNPRAGTFLEEYLPAVHLLNESGYRVLLVGDLQGYNRVSNSLYHQFGGLLVDAHNLGADKQWFDLFAATEADIFIGEHGGGVFPALANRVPMLVMNLFPYFVGFPNAWHYYKTLRDQNGSLVPYQKLFLDHSFDFEMVELTKYNNTSSEIEDAVRCFIEDVSHRGEPDPNAHVIEQLPDFSWLKYAPNARLSPAWLRLYDRLGSAQ